MVTLAAAPTPGLGGFSAQVVAGSNRLINGAADGA